MEPSCGPRSIAFGSQALFTNRASSLDSQKANREALPASAAYEDKERIPPQWSKVRIVVPIVTGSRASKGKGAAAEATGSRANEGEGAAAEG